MNDYSGFNPERNQDFEEQMEYEFAMQDQAQRVRELEELLTIAEASAENVDKLSEAVDQNRSKLFIATAVMIFLLAVFGGAAFLYFVGGFGVGLVYNYLSVVSVSFVCLVFFPFLIILRKYSLQISRLKRGLSVEVDIHHRLISMIDQQLQRVTYGGYYSPVHRAIIDIRVRRIMRS